MASMKDFTMHLIIISAERYEELVAAEKKLLKLEAAGVDNWERYPAFREDEDEKD